MSWSSDPILELLPGTREIRLPVDLTWTDPVGLTHTVPAGFVSDGLTAPAWTWGLIGSPLTPRYRRPALLHDWQVLTQCVRWEDSVFMLEETLREGGTGRLRTWLFVALVFWFGPRW